MDSGPFETARFNEGPGYLHFCHVHSKAGLNEFASQVHVVLCEGDGELYIRKRVNNAPNVDGMPPEVRFSTKTILPQTSNFVSLSDWHEHSPGSYSMIFPFSNGGDLASILRLYWMRKEMLPEAFIWHFVNQIGRAVAFLQLGYEEAKPLPDRWKPIVHRDLGSSNIFIHWPEFPPGHSTPNYPHLVLGDFEFGAYVGDIQYRHPGESFETAPPAVWEDMYFFGELVMRLATCPFQDPLDYDLETDFKSDGISAEYSDELVRMIRAFEVDRLKIAANHGVHVPTARRLVDEWLPLAKYKLRDLQAQGRVANLIGFGVQGMRRELWGKALQQNKKDITRLLKPWRLVLFSPRTSSLANIEPQPDWITELDAAGITSEEERREK